MSGTERVNKTMIQYVDIVKMNQLYILFRLFKLAVGFRCLQSCHFDEAAPTRPLAVPCKPNPIGPKQSNAAKGASQLLTSWNLQDVAEGLQHQAGSCER